jgi:hypothetical protein
MMEVYFQDTGAPPIEQSELLARRAEYRIQGVPLLRLTPRATRGGGFGDIEKRPNAWTIWVMTDGRWRRVDSARGNPREWTSLDRAHAWLLEMGFDAFAVDAGLPDHG